MEKLVSELRQTFNSGVTRPIQWRISQLKGVIKLLEEQKESAVQALNQDLKQNFFIAELAEIGLPVKEAEFHLAHLSEWLKPTVKDLDFMSKPGKGTVQYDPLGVVLIISPWNYPISLLLKPLIGALSAGNVVILKPSEVSSSCSTWFANNISKYLDNNCVRVIEGGPDVTTELLKQRFDHIFYTGSTMVGKIVMKAAAEHLTPVTLELGGKSPCIVDKDANLDVSVRRICSGKFSNSGQTCVAPDFILLHHDIEKEFIIKMKETIKAFYGDNPQTSSDYSRIINERHTVRVASLLKDHDNSKILHGGRVDEKDRYIEPTLIKVDINDDSKLMQEEIFGPLLPIITVSSIDEAINYVNTKPKPLALYVFTQNQDVSNKVLEYTTSGGAGVNETVMHVACTNLPFGGVGPSGMGSYNGKKTFETFSHQKSVLTKPTWPDPSIRYPPFDDNKIWWVKKLMGLKHVPKKYILLLILPILIGIAIRSRM